MQISSKLRSLTLGLCASAALIVSAPSFAQHGGGGHAGGHGGAVGHGGGYGGWHGGYGGGWRGGYGGWRGGYGGWRGGGYGWRGGYWGPWGWGGVGLGLGLGLYFSTLPYSYSTYYWGGVPYYYADNTYYVWNSGVGQYQTVAPPPEVQGQAGGQGTAPSTDLIAYPKNGQSQEQVGKDKFECHKWAVAQTGFDPTQAGGGAAPDNRSNYVRAQSACLEGRGYSVK
jgi:hypothetical protein